MNVVIKVLVWIAWSVLLALNAAAWATTFDSDGANLIIAIDREHRSHAEKTSAINSAFTNLEAHYSDFLSHLNEASPEDLYSAWRLSAFMAYATNEYRFAANMKLVHSEFVRRGTVPPIELRERLLDTLIGLKKFEEAKAYADETKMPIEYLPSIGGVASTSISQPSILKVDVDRGILIRENVKLENDVHVFVVSFIGCAFSRRAADAIEKNEFLSNFMRTHGDWVVLPGPLYFKDVVSWNRSHASTGFSYLDQMERWSFIDDWATPTFYFVKAGKVAAKVTGWPNDETGIANLMDAVIATGVGKAR